MGISQGLLVETGCQISMEFILYANFLMKHKTLNSFCEVSFISLMTGISIQSLDRIFSISVLDINDVPTISDISDQVTDENTATAPVPFMVNDEDTPGDPLTVNPLRYFLVGITQ